MRYRAVAFDYDGTLARDGQVHELTRAALERLERSGLHAVLVTGRLLDDLEATCPCLHRFDRVVAENGGLLYRPQAQTVRTLGEAVPPALVDALRNRDVQLSVGRVVASTNEPHEATVRDTLRDLGLNRRLIRNKGALMLLPDGVHKGSGLLAALREIEVSPEDTVGVGDAENDLEFLDRCGRAVAVANALAEVRKVCDLTTPSEDGSGVVELVDALVADDLQRLAAGRAAGGWVLNQALPGDACRAWPRHIRSPRRETPTMFARVNTFQAPAERRDEIVRSLQQDFLPRIRQLDGYRGSFTLADQQWGRLLTVALYEDQQSMQAAAEAASALRGEVAQQLGLELISVEEYEVVVDDRQQ